jgi:hypothetical protein
MRIYKIETMIDKDSISHRDCTVFGIFVHKGVDSYRFVQNGSLYGYYYTVVNTHNSSQALTDIKRIQ